MPFLLVRAVRVRTFVVVSLALLSLGHSSVQAQPTGAAPLKESLSFGAPARTIPLEVAVSEEGHRLVVGRGRSAASATLPIASDVTVTLRTEVVTLSRGSVALAHVEGGGRHQAFLITARRGRATIAWQGELTARGDRGEQQRDVILTEDKNGDGVVDIVVGVERDDTRICGQEATLLSPRALDPQTMALRSVTLSRLTEREELTLDAVEASPAPRAAPLIAGARFNAASSTAGYPDLTIAPPPTALNDDDSSTLWIEGSAGNGRGEFVTATSVARPIHALRFTTSPDQDANAAALARPQSVMIVPASGPRFRVSFPEVTAGVPLYVRFPTPLQTSCLSVVLDQPRDGAPPNARTALAGIAVFTDVDFGDGVATLIRDLSRDGPRVDAAIRALTLVGEPAVPALAAQWNQMPSGERRSAIRVYRALARDHVSARQALVAAAQDDDQEVAEQALSALGESGDVSSFVTLAASRDDAALQLARRFPDEAIPALITQINREPDRAPLRDALRTALRRTDARPDQTARAAELSHAGAASVALAMSSTAPALALPFLQHAQASDAFADHYRIVRAAQSLPREAESADAIDEWLASRLTSEAWALRAETLRALVARRAPSAAAHAREALADDAPRVRVAAIEILADSPEDLERVATLARRDAWPMVRAAGVAALVHHERARPVVAAALRDRHERVRAAAVSALHDNDASFEAVVARLEDDDEWPVVLEAAISFVERRCDRDAVPALTAVLDRALRPNPWTPDIDVAAKAVTVLARIGGEAAQAQLERASAELAPAPLRNAVRYASTHPSSCLASHE